MKNTFAQIQFMVTKIDRRYIQFVYFALVLAGAFIAKAPTDGGGGPY